MGREMTNLYIRMRLLRKRSHLRKSLQTLFFTRGYGLTFRISLHDNGFKKMITSLTALMSKSLFISRASPLCHTTRGAGALSASRRWKRVSLGIRRGPSRKVKSRRRPARKDDEDNLRRASFSQTSGEFSSCLGCIKPNSPCEKKRTGAKWVRIRSFSSGG